MNFIDKKRYWENDQQLKLYWIYFFLQHYIRQEQKLKKGLKTSKKGAANKFPKTYKKHIKCNLKRPDVTLVQMVFLFEN